MLLSARRLADPTPDDPYCVPRPEEHHATGSETSETAPTPAPAPGPSQYVVVSTEHGEKLLVPLHDVVVAPAPAPKISGPEIDHYEHVVRGLLRGLLLACSSGRV